MGEWKWTILGREKWVSSSIHNGLDSVIHPIPSLNLDPFWTHYVLLNLFLFFFFIITIIIIIIVKKNLCGARKGEMKNFQADIEFWFKMRINLCLAKTYPH